MLSRGAMTHLRRIVWRVSALKKRFWLLRDPVPDDAGVPLEIWLNQYDLWKTCERSSALIEIAQLIQSTSAGCEHRVLDSDADSITLCSELDVAVTRERLAFLAEAGAFLGSSLDLDTLLASATRVAVPFLADWCVLRVGPTLPARRRMRVAHRDPAVERQIAAIDRRRAGRAAWGVTLRGEGSSLTLIDVRRRAAAVQSVRPGWRWELRALGLTSEMTVKVDLHGAKVADMTFASTRATRSFNIGDLVMAQELGRRLALALDHGMALERVRSALRRGDRVLATVSHDLRNPLAAILMRAEALLRSTSDQHGRDGIEAIRKCARQMSRLTEDLLAVARPERSGLLLRLRRELVRTLLAEAWAMNEPLAAAKGQSLRIIGSVPNAAVECDSSRLLQVFSNIVGNAIKFTPAGGAIELSAAEGEDEVNFTITDTGPGIPPDELERIFDEFWQGDPSDARGVGLGLSIVKRLITAHGGRVWVDSSPRGTTFYFTVPRADIADRPSVERAAPQRALSARVAAPALLPSPVPPMRATR
jgi:signal transduction histidine kinase